MNNIRTRRPSAAAGRQEEWVGREGTAEEPWRWDLGLGSSTMVTERALVCGEWDRIRIGQMSGRSASY